MKGSFIIKSITLYPTPKCKHAMFSLSLLLEEVKLNIQFQVNACMLAQG